MVNFKHSLSDVLDFVFPRLCITCGERLNTVENHLCFTCWNDLPLTHFHTEPENKVAQLFWGRVHIQYATSFFSYKKGSRYQQLIHYIKYKGFKELGFETGQRFGYALGGNDNFRSVDVVVPVPLHPKKEKMRGYNQCLWIAMGISEAMDKKLSGDNLYRRIFTSTQTRKNRFERWQNVEGIFGIHHPEDFIGKHILLVDDVVTTGSTLEACAYQLLQLEGTKVSIATLAFADL